MIDGYKVGYWCEVQDAMFLDEPIAPNWDAIDETGSEMQRWNEYCMKVMMAYLDYDLDPEAGGILNFLIKKAGSGGGSSGGGSNSGKDGGSTDGSSGDNSGSRNGTGDGESTNNGTSDETQQNEVESNGVNASSYSILGILLSHFIYGGGRDLFVDATTMDFSNTSQKELGLEQKEGKQSIQLYDHRINELSLAFGRLDFYYVGNNQFEIGSNRVDFNGIDGKEFLRDAATVAAFGIYWGAAALVRGGYLLRGGIDPTNASEFKVIFNGRVTIKR